MRKVLVLTYDFPYPTNSGGKSRIFNLLKFAKDKDIEFYLYSFTRSGFKEEYKKELENIGVSKIYLHLRKPVKNLSVALKTSLGKSSVFRSLYYEKTVEHELEEIIKELGINVILFESFYTSFYISKKWQKLGVKQIFGTENIEHELYYDFAMQKPPILRKLFMKQVERVRKEEEGAYELSDSILTITQEEKEYISKKTKTDLFVIPNGVDTKDLSFKEKKTATRNLLFVGNFSYFPNIDAIKFFYHEVFLQIPEVTLTIVGKNQQLLSFIKSDTRIKSIEYIENIKEVYYDADLFVFPVRFGGGTNFKVLEAASCGVPIVAIPDRVKGLGFQENKEYIAAKTSQEFIFGINTLFEDKSLRNKISKNAREHVEKNFDWKRIGKNLNDIMMDYE